MFLTPKHFDEKIALAIWLGALLAVGGLYSIYLELRAPWERMERACTQEVMLCPDGSVVSRIGPNCEFTECAKTVAQVEGSPSTSSGQLGTSSWKTYRNEEYGFEFRYLSSWSIKDITWPIRLFESGEDIITLSTMDLRVAGITYCGAYPQDARCELIGSWMIDWGDSTIVTAQINHADGMTAVLTTLYKTSAKNKKDFKQFLSTFKFTQ